jgi:molybdopterin converting factor small subunit
MQVKVRLYSILREKLPPEAEGRATLTLKEGATITDLLDAMDIERNVVVSVNGEHERDLDQPLKDEDLVRLFSSVSGGAVCQIHRSRTRKESI